MVGTSNILKCINILVIRNATNILEVLSIMFSSLLIYIRNTEFEKIFRVRVYARRGMLIQGLGHVLFAIDVIV